MINQIRTNTNMKMIKDQLAKILSKQTGMEISASDFGVPPNEKMGDISLPCFDFAKKVNKNPKDLAEEIAGRLQEGQNTVLSVLTEKIESIGPFVNFFINPNYLMNAVFARKSGKKLFGKKKIMVEFAHPNTHKAFHIGHLRNIITGESISRILENAGNKVVRANYQGDVGLHIGKALYGIERIKADYSDVKNGTAEQKIAFLGRAYAIGGAAYEENEEAKIAIHELSRKVYNSDKSIKEIYQTTRKWSLEYLDHIYNRVGTHFDRLYFESEVFVKAKKIVEKFLAKNVFKKSDGAIIFEGEKYGLHNRVFITSDGSPMYEAKDLALAELQFKEYHPDKLIHVVGKEQTEYFKVLFKAMEFVFPKNAKKESHLPYGWVSLKSGKMSSRTGQVVLGEWLLDEIEKRIAETMKDHELENKNDVVKKVSLAAVKYAMLRLNIGVDMAFDIEESISLSGDSGPYLLYIGARINSILEKSKAQNSKSKISSKFKAENFKGEIHQSEKTLLLKLMKFEEACFDAAEELNPSIIAKYLFDLAQTFNGFYQECPILAAEENVRAFRLMLIKKIREAMEQGLNLLGIEMVDRM